MSYPKDQRRKDIQNLCEAYKFYQPHFILIQQSLTELENACSEIETESVSNPSSNLNFENWRDFTSDCEFTLTELKPKYDTLISLFNELSSLLKNNTF